MSVSFMGRLERIAPPSSISTDRLVLSKTGVEDAPALHPIMSDPEVSRFLTWTTHAAPADTNAALETYDREWNAGSRFAYSIRFKNPSVPIGIVEMTIEGNSIGLGDFIHRDHWRKSISKEAFLSLASWAFRNTDAWRAYSVCEVGCLGAARGLEKIGFRKEGTFRRFMTFPNLSAEPRDCFVYAFTRDDGIV